MKSAAERDAVNLYNRRYRSKPKKIKKGEDDSMMTSFKKWWNGLRSKA